MRTRPSARLDTKLSLIDAMKSRPTVYTAVERSGAKAQGFGKTSFSPIGVHRRDVER